MSKLFAHMFLSLLISLGLIAGVPSLRKEATHVFDDIKASAQYAVNTTVSTANDLPSQVDSKLEVDASSNTTVNLDSQTQTKINTKTMVDDSAQISLGDNSVKVNGNAQTNLNLGLTSGK